MVTEQELSEEQTLCLLSTEVSKQKNVKIILCKLPSWKKEIGPRTLLPTSLLALLMNGIKTQIFNSLISIVV